MDNNSGYENYAQQMNLNFGNLKAMALSKKRQDDLEQFQAVEEKYEGLDAVGQKYMETSGFITGVGVAGKGAFKGVKNFIEKHRTKTKEAGEDEEGDLADEADEGETAGENIGTDVVEEAGSEGRTILNRVADGMDDLIGRVSGAVDRAGEKAISAGKNFINNLTRGGEAEAGEAGEAGEEGFTFVGEPTSDLPSLPSAFNQSSQMGEGGAGDIEMTEVPNVESSINGGGSNTFTYNPEDERYLPDSGGEYEDEADDVYEAEARNLPPEGEGQTGFGTPYESKQEEPEPEDEDDGFVTAEDYDDEEPEGETGETGIAEAGEAGETGIAEAGEIGAEAGELGVEAGVEAGLGVADAIGGAIPIVGEVLMAGSALAVAGIGVYNMIKGGEERTEESAKQQALLKQAPTPINPQGKYVVGTTDATNEISSHFSGF